MIKKQIFKLGLGACITSTLLLSACTDSDFAAIGELVSKAISSNDSDSNSSSSSSSSSSTSSSADTTSKPSSSSSSSAPKNLRNLTDGQPVSQQNSSLAGASASVLTIDLSDKNTVFDLNFAQNASKPGNGFSDFFSFIGDSAGAINGSYFNTQTGEVLGNSIKQGTVAQYRAWDDRGTALGITADNRAEMITIRRDGWPDYKKYWMSIAAGPRLLTNGQMSLNPSAEGFQDPKVFSANSRSAIGISSDGTTLYLVSFQSAISLEQEASAMQSLGASNAMNLDGGGSVGQAFRGQPMVNPGRALTNVLVVYDAQNPAPSNIIEARDRFIKNGLNGAEQIRSGKPPKYSPDSFKNNSGEPPPDEFPF